MSIEPQFFKNLLYSLPIGTAVSSPDPMALTTAGTQPSLGEVAGIPLPATTVDNWPQIQGFKAQSDDLLICTYPKSGSCGLGRQAPSGPRSLDECLWGSEGPAFLPQGQAPQGA